MLSPRLTLAAAALFTLAEIGRAQSPAPLRVIRNTPGAETAPITTISVTFDRPVAGSLDRSIDPATIFRVEPAIPGKLEWRDPVTIRLTPSAPLTARSTYTVTIANTFKAMDGSALAEAKQFTFRVQDPRLLGGSPVNANERPDDVTPAQLFTLVYSAEVDVDLIIRSSYLEFSAACANPRMIRFKSGIQRRLTRADRGLNGSGGWSRDVALDSLRRVIVLTPEAPLPHGCIGELVVPTEADPQISHGYSRWPLETYGDFRITAFDCDNAEWCPTGPLNLHFNTAIRGSDVMRYLHLEPAIKFTVYDTNSYSKHWSLDATFARQTVYTATLDTALRDKFGQSLLGRRTWTFKTTSFAPGIEYPYGNLLVERAGFKTLSVHHVNVDTLVATITPIPDSLEARALTRFGWSDDSLMKVVLGAGTEQRIATHGVRDRLGVTAVHLTPPDASQPGSPTLFAVRVHGRAGGKDVKVDAPIALLQVTDLGVHARIGAAEGTVWVTGVNDGSARGGASVVLYSREGRRIASGTSDARGLARLTGWVLPPKPKGDTTSSAGVLDEGYVEVTLDKDRAIASFNSYDPELSSWRFGVNDAWGQERLPVAGGVFTERGIYRPGEKVYAKAIVRDGALGALHLPEPGDSIKWRFHDRDEGVLRETTMKLSSFGTCDASLVVPSAAPLGTYTIEILVKRLGGWHEIGTANYRVAEYRPPEFLVTLSADTVPHFPGDTITVPLSARYLFGAPMGRAALSWTATVRPLQWWDLAIPGLADWYIGNATYFQHSGPQPFGGAADTLDVRGERSIRIAAPPVPVEGRAAEVRIETVVTDINRQVVGSSTTSIVHPADFYIASKPLGKDYFWKADSAQSVAMLVVHPRGDTIAGVPVHGRIIRREWHNVLRERNGAPEQVGEWVSDTVARCELTSAARPVTCDFTPRGGGEYHVLFTSVDRAGRAVTGGFSRWVTGSDWVPWNDESQFKMDVLPDKQRYSVGDTATVLFASPFTNAQAWITVEREGIIEQRRITLTSGSTVAKFRITEAYAPNAFISIIVTRGRSAEPAKLDDPGRPTIRVGYAALRVTPEVKRLTVALAPEKTEYRPGDSSRVRIAVKDAAGKGQRSEVTLWAVDEGVLALTGYITPDPLDLIYRERGLGVRLRSNLTAVAPQVPEGTKGTREPGGGGGAAGADVLRSKFQTTAFFLGSVVTDASGNAVAAAKLPDNLTTFRVMAVAVTAGDRYGKGESELLVTRPLLARQALPRFLRPGDDFVAGAVINRRDGAVATVNVSATASGVTLDGPATRSVTLAASKGAEVRFPFKALRMDNATFRFDVAGAVDTDAVKVTLPIRPDYHPLAHTMAGVLRDSATVDFTLPSNVDPARSRLSLSLGASPLAMVRGMNAQLRVYPYLCTEQVVSAAAPLIALYRVQKETGVSTVTADAPGDIVRAITMLTRRQGENGGIGYWDNRDWTTPWLTAYAGMVLIDAREVGFQVDSQVLNGIARYVREDLHRPVMTDADPARLMSPAAAWERDRKVRLSHRVAGVDFLSRFGRPDIPSENELVRTAPQLSMEDRARLAEALVRRKQVAVARQLMAPTWAAIRVDGMRATIPDSLGTALYFRSEVRPIARILTATLAVEPTHKLIGPLVETITQMSRPVQSARYWWNTQDFGSAIVALATLDRAQRANPARTVRMRAGGRVVIAGTRANRAGRDSSVALTGLLTDGATDKTLHLSLDAGPGEGVVYYYLTVTEAPLAGPVTPQDNGIQIERWYEKYTGGAPITTAVEGDIVRVRIKITVPTARQFVVLDDALPAGLEAIDLSLRTASALPGPGTSMQQSEIEGEGRDGSGTLMNWMYGSWDAGWWSPFDHRELRDDRVVWAATVLFPGTYTATYIARATTPGTFVRPPTHAEEMYNPGANGRSDGGFFTVTQRK